MFGPDWQTALLLLQFNQDMGKSVKERIREASERQSTEVSLAKCGLKTIPDDVCPSSIR
jgi:hypothetical protein